MKIVPEMDCTVKRTLKRSITSIIFNLENYIFAYLTLTFTLWPWKWILIIKIVPQIDSSIKNTPERGRLLHLLLFVFVKSHMFTVLTLELTFWLRRWPWISKILLEKDFVVQNFSKKMLLHLFLIMLVQHDIFNNLTSKLTLQMTLNRSDYTRN